MRLSPMLATPGPLPIGPAWVYEIKFDGWRALVELHTDGVLRWHSRGGNDLERMVDLDELVRPAALAGRDAVLDGELVGVDEQGKLGKPRTKHLLFIVFDILRLDGGDLIGLPWTERRALLESLAIESRTWWVSDVFDDGAELLRRGIGWHYRARLRRHWP